MLNKESRAAGGGQRMNYVPPALGLGVSRTTVYIGKKQKNIIKY
jgi:hypothetical protein